MYKVVLDGFGGDNAPGEVILGGIAALKADSELELVITGKREELKAELYKAGYSGERIEIVDAPDVITCNEVPTQAIKTKPNSSLMRAIDRLKADTQCIGMVSAGSTGAVLMGATVFLGRIKGITRPALAPILPTLTGGKVLLIDCGANSDCKASLLPQFALLGSAYMRAVMGIENVRVGLLSNGAEDEKGNELIKEANGLLRASDLNFVGNIEGRDILSGCCDVVVADGFSGNIALKSTEGAALSILKMLKNTIMSGGLRAKLGALLLKPTFKKLKKSVDFNEHGGAAFLGVIKPVIKSHGSSKASSIKGSIEQVVTMHKGNMIASIEAELTK